MMAWLGGLSASCCFHSSVSGPPNSGSSPFHGSVGDAGLVRSMGVDPLDGGSGVILGIISSKILESVSIGDGGNADNNGTMSSNRAGGSQTGGATDGAAGGMTGGMVGGATGGAAGGAAGGMIGGGTMGTVLGAGGMGGTVDDGGGEPPPPLGGLVCLFIRFPKV